MNKQQSVPTLQPHPPKSRVSASWKALWSDERGQGMTEYVVILVAIAVVCIAITVQFGGKIKALFEDADIELGGVTQNY